MFLIQKYCMNHYKKEKLRYQCFPGLPNGSPPASQYSIYLYFNWFVRVVCSVFFTENLHALFISCPIFRAFILCSPKKQFS